MKILKFNPKKGKAQAIVEFAIVLPILLLVVYGLIETGRLLFIYSSVNNAARQAVRYGSTSGVGPNGVPRYQDCAGIRAAAQASDFLNAFDDADIVITYDRPTAGTPNPADYDTCNGATDTGITSVTGDRVNVSIQGDFTAIVPNLVPLISRPINAESARTLLLTIDIEPPKENTVTLITSDVPDPSEIGQYATVSVTVTANTTPTGTVTITGADENCTLTLGGGGSGSCLVRFTAVGTRTLTASYGGDATHNPSSDTEAHTVIKASTVTNIVSDIPDPSVTNQPFTVTVNVTSAWATPTGTITISGADSSNCQPLSGSNGSATTTCLVTYTSVGPKLFTATYDGDAEHEVSSDSEPHGVLPPGQSTTTIAPTNPDPSPPGQPVTVNVTVTGSVTPTGTVTVTGADAPCTITLVNGAGSCVVSFSTSGPKTLTANYPGDNNNQGSSDTESHAVEIPATVTTIVSDLPDPSTSTQQVTVVVSVTGGSTPPTGTVTVTTPGGTFCVITLPANSCTGTFNTAGLVTLTATYSGDSAHASSVGTATHSVSVAGCNTTNLVLGRLQMPGNSTMTVSIDNKLPVAIQFSNISVTWNHDKGQKNGDDKTLILKGITLGSFNWTGTQLGPTYTVVPSAPAYIPSGISTLVFTFHQEFNRWDDTEQVTINLATPGCEGVILFQNQHN